MKDFADNKINVTQKLNFALGRVVKHCGKWRKCWLPAISPFSTRFPIAFFLRIIKSRDCVALYHTNPTFNDPNKEAFCKHCEKWRKCSLPVHFLLFPQLSQKLSLSGLLKVGTITTLIKSYYVAAKDIDQGHLALSASTNLGQNICYSWSISDVYRPV